MKKARMSGVALFVQKSVINTIYNGICYGFKLSRTSF